MAEGGPGRGRGGRGAIIAKLLEMERRPGQPLVQQPPPDQPPITQPLTEQPPDHPSQDSLSTTTVQEAPMAASSQRPVIGGRGAIFQRIQQAAAEKATASLPILPTEQPSISTSVSSEPQRLPPVSRGRGKMFEMAQRAHTQPGQTVKPASLITAQDTKTSLSQPEQTPSATQSQPLPRQDPEVGNIARRFTEVQIDPDRPPVVMQGREGREFAATANYIPLYLQPGRGIFEYEVKFSPDVDDMAFRYKLLFGQHRELLGPRRTFDGSTLYLPHKLEENVINLMSVHPVSNETHTISLIFKRIRSMGECTHMYNVLFNNIQRELNLVRLGREYFAEDMAHTIPQHKLEIWPGYVTAVDAFEGGIMLNCNASHKVLRTQTVLDVIKDILASPGGNRDWKERLQKMLIGQSVMTRRPVNIYRVDDIDFNQNPTSIFQKPDGTTMTYIEYHRRKDIEIRDRQQPLLVHRPKPSKRPGGTGLFMLVPELCFLTGLTDEMRADYKVMKDVAIYTRINPNQRQLTLQKFIDSIRASPNCVKLLDEWGLKVPDKTVEITGRTLDPEQLFFGRDKVDRGSENADWGRAATNSHMLETVDIFDWMVVHTFRDERNARDFVGMMSKVCPQMGVRIENPKMQKLQDDKTDTYVKTMKEVLSDRLQLVVVIFPSARDDRYSAVKKLCCVERPIPSQVINSRTISKPDKLRSIVQKIALQINCKLGGALWAIKIPFKKAMICGIDTYHDTKTRAQSVAGFVASMNPSVTRWHSQVFLQSSDREMVDGLRIALHTALNKYYEVNNHHPDTVIIFRDGVGDGQLQVCKEHEVEVLKKAFKTIGQDYKPGLAFIVCQKRINTRIFWSKRIGDYDNPLPGSVVDHTVTRRYLYDFFLVSQLVRQGTVTPTHYVVLHNDTRLDPDKIQKLTYKMCHLYYNWPGTIRVPAPCQYAHKLAHLVGNSIHKEPARVLCDKLFFL